MKLDRKQINFMVLGIGAILLIIGVLIWQAQPEQPDGPGPGVITEDIGAICEDAGVAAEDCFEN